MKCSNCGMDIPFSGNVCPYCKRDKSGDQLLSIIGTVVGIFLLIGFIGCLCNNSKPQGATPPSVPATNSFHIGSPARTYSVTIHDGLGPNQLREEVTITLGGVEKTLVVDGATPRAGVSYTGVQAGSYVYMIRSRTLVMIDGMARWVSSSASGRLSVNGDLHLDLLGNYQPLTQTFDLILRPRS